MDRRAAGCDGDAWIDEFVELEAAMSVAIGTSPRHVDAAADVAREGLIAHLDRPLESGNLSARRPTERGRDQLRDEHAAQVVHIRNLTAAHDELHAALDAAYEELAEIHSTITWKVVRTIRRALRRPAGDRA